MRSILCAAAVALFAGAAVAQVPLPGAKGVQKTSSTTTASTTAATPKAAPQAQTPRTATSLQCSKDADAKNLHGKPRKAFMSQCKKAAKS